MHDLWQFDHGPQYVEEHQRVLLRFKAEDQHLAWHPLLVHPQLCEQQSNSQEICEFFWLSINPVHIIIPEQLFDEMRNHNDLFFLASKQFDLDREHFTEWPDNCLSFLNQYRHCFGVLDS